MPTHKENPELGYFFDGKGPKSKDTPDEFASDWHYQAEVDALERAVAGAENRVLQLTGTDGENGVAMAEAKSAVEAAKANLARYQKPKAKAKAKK